MIAIKIKKVMSNSEVQEFKKKILFRLIGYPIAFGNNFYIYYFQYK